MMPVSPPSIGGDGSPEKSVIPHLRYLDGLRGLTALLVVLHHVFAEISPNGDASGLPRKVAYLMHPLAFGHLAVGVFIVLSGFVLMLPVACRPQNGLGREGLRGFVFRRARRILPPYYAALGSSLLLIAVFAAQLGQLRGVRWDVALPVWEGRTLLSHVLLVHNFSPDTLVRINPPFWSIAVEWQIYFVFAFLLFPLWRKTGYKAVWPLVIVLGVGPHFFVPNTINGDWFCPWYLICFTMGMAAASLSFGPQTLPTVSWQARRARYALWATVLFAAGTLITVGLGLRWWYAHILVSDLLLGSAAAAFLVYAACSARQGAAQNLPFPLRVLQSRVLLALGAFSYSLYLVHFPLLSLLHAFLRPHFASGPLPTTLKLLTLFGLGVPLCLAAAYGFYLIFERPFVGKNAPRLRVRRDTASGQD